MIQRGELAQLAGAEPHEFIARGETEILVLGTAHVSKASADAVQRLIASGQFDRVAVELCEPRATALRDPEAWRKLDLFSIIRRRRAGMVAANLALGAYQQRIAEQYGVVPGAELRAAIDEAEKQDLPIELIDREVGITLRRVFASLNWWDKFKLLGGLLSSLFVSEEVSADEIERLKEGDLLESTFREFALRSQNLYRSLIDERDQYMAKKLEQAIEQHQPQRVLAVVGAGHLAGLASYLEEPDRLDTELAELESVPPAAVWTRALPWLVTAAVVGTLAYAFSRNTELGLELTASWILINGGLAALGAIAALAHPATIVASFFAAPVTSLIPAIGAGIAAALLETTLRKPTVADFETLRRDVQETSGWWKNRVSRVLLVLCLVNLGSAIGTWVAGLKIVNSLL